MRVVVALLLSVAACAPAVQSPEDFVEPYLESYCKAGVECRKYSDTEQCLLEINADGWREGCTTANQPDWDPERAAECLSSVETYACGEESTDEHPCRRICSTQGAR